MEMFENNLTVQLDNIEKLKTARKNYKKTPKERLTETYVNVRLEQLQGLWSDFANFHKELVFKYKSALNDTDYMKKDFFSMAEEFYIDHKTELQSMLHFLQMKTADQKGEASVASVSSKNGTDAQKNFQVKLPNIVIPTFSGKYTEWITFRDMFVSMIHNNDTLDNVQKMHYLKGYLTGEAEQLLRQIPISDANYLRCWTQLKERYDNKRFLSHFILKRLLSQKNITAESSNSLKELMDTTNDCLNGLSNLGVDTKSWDILIIHILTLKLDSESRKQWEFFIVDANSTKDLPTFKQFEDFLTNRYKALEFLDPRSSVSKTQPISQHQNVPKLKSLHVSKIQCPLCLEAHRLNGCKKFIKQTVDERRHFVQVNNICFNCLGSNHSAKFCQSNMKCKLCHRHHHTLLHPRGSDATAATGACSNPGEVPTDGSAAAAPAKRAGNNTIGDTQVVSCFSKGEKATQVLLATALVNADSKNGSHVLRALLDQGSQGNFITESVVQDLKLEKEPVRGVVTGIGDGDEVVSKATVTIKIRSRINPNVTVPVQAYVLKTITTFLPNRKVGALEWSNMEGMALADPAYGKPNKIDLLLGAEIYSQVIQDGIKKDHTGLLVAQATSLGWIISGAINSSPKKGEGILSLHCQIQEEDDMLKKFWEIESDTSLSETSKFSKEEIRCEEIYSATTTRDEDGRYVVRLPFKTEDPDCKRGETRKIAEKRIKQLETRLNKDINMKKKFTEILEEYLQLGHMEEVKNPDTKQDTAFYLPYHAVVREDKDTTKVRLVFNGSQKGKNGVSLNDDLLVGPTIQSDLRNLVLRWRLTPICLTADIVKMYRQVKVHPDDADFQRILWKNEDVIKDYRMLRVTFGLASAPFLAIRTLNQVAEDDGKNFPMATERVKTDFYVDDLMTGCSTIEEGVEVYRQMNQLLSGAGFTLQKWTSNSEELLKRITEKKEHAGKEKEELYLKIDEVIKILGLTWERKSDNFRYVVKLPELQSPITKRKILSDISKLFDPLGWIAPCVIVAKVIIQKLWLVGINWDDEVPKETLNEWLTYRNELPTLEEVRIPRWIGTKTDDVRRELHGFCDASKTAYAAVVYCRTVDVNGKVTVTLIAAKSKVSPIKQVSIPRLELCGAVLLTRLVLDVAKIIGVDKSNIHAWTDSTIVLAWLNSHPNRWKVFVANRVSEILTSLEPHQWSHVSTKLNPADCASRGLTPSEMKQNNIWFHGPLYLLEKEIKYEKPRDVTTDLEAVRTHQATVNVDGDMFEKYSTLSKLIRVVAYCRRFLTKPEKKKGHLKPEELREALETCIKKVQRDNFKDEIEVSQTKMEIKVNKKSILRSLNPYLDEKNILRVGGRLEQSYLKANRRHPIIIPKNCSLAKLIINDAHRQTCHGGVQLTLNYIINRYYIPGVKQLIKAHIRKCVICVKNAGITRNQLMGQLPSVRASPSRPFSNSGVDFAGPIQIRTAKGRGHKSYKGYICLFICMCTRAVHVEAVSDLTTQGFLQAFKRFVARRGPCQQIWSDNGTNFIGAAGELKKLFLAEKGGLHPELSEILANNGTAWHFIPPHSPNFGGLWEGGIKSVKFHLKRVIGESTLTFEEMATVLAQVEACLNSRPLSRITSERDDDFILTPGHFLVGTPLITAPDYNYESATVSSLQRWQYTQRLLQHFWSKWSQEYLNQFFHRYRWSSEVSEPKLGDVVLIKEDGLPPCRWLYGRIVDVHPGKDNLIRVVSVQTKGSTIKRPMSKICVLPTTE